jgi:hypothetical protein
VSRVPRYHREPSVFLIRQLLHHPPVVVSWTPGFNIFRLLVGNPRRREGVLQRDDRALPATRSTIPDTHGEMSRARCRARLETCNDFRTLKLLASALQESRRID